MTCEIFSSGHEASRPLDGRAGVETRKAAAPCVHRCVAVRSASLQSPGLLTFRCVKYMEIDYKTLFLRQAGVSYFAPSVPVTRPGARHLCQPSRSRTAHTSAPPPDRHTGRASPCTAHPTAASHAVPRTRVARHGSWANKQTNKGVRTIENVCLFVCLFERPGVARAACAPANGQNLL